MFQGATMYSSQPFQRSPSPTFPLCDTSGTPSPCVHPTDAYRHDGFYLRLTGGPSYVAFSGSGRSGGASVSGLGSGETIAVGGTPATGVAVAGAFRVLSDRDQFHGSPHQPEGYASVGSVGVGLLVDWFPSATGGWHVGGMAAVTALVMTDSWIADSSGGAYTGTILGGYDWWIGPQWSLGVMAVLSASTSAKLADEHGNDTGYRFNAFSAGLEYALTLH